jgi:hypothetical protein
MPSPRQDTERAVESVGCRPGPSCRARLLARHSRAPHPHILSGTRFCSLRRCTLDHAVPQPWSTSATSSISTGASSGRAAPRRLCAGAPRQAPHRSPGARWPPRRPRADRSRTGRWQRIRRASRSADGPRLGVHCRDGVEDSDPCQPCCVLGGEQARPHCPWPLSGRAPPTNGSCHDVQTPEPLRTAGR